MVNGACGVKPVHDKRKQRAYRGYQTTKPAKALAAEQVPQEAKVHRQFRILGSRQGQADVRGARPHIQENMFTLVAL